MKRRGLSTVIGATFFVIVMATSIGYITYSLDLIDDLARQVDVKQDTNLNRQNEEFKISQVRVDGISDEFNLTVTNTGNIPINITRMWAKNMTDSSWNQTKYQLNQLVTPGQTITNVGQGTGLVAMNTSSYLLKLVTERGNSLTTQVLSSGGVAIEMNLFTAPSSPLDKQYVALLYTVKNNLTEASIIQSLTPSLDVTTSGGTASFTRIDGPTPATVEGLNPNESAIFEWIYEVGTNNADQITFNATVANAVKGNFVEDTVTIDIAPVAEVAINEALGGAVGKLTLNFTSFELCEPAPDDCTSDSSAWEEAWTAKKNTKFLWRMNVTNSGAKNIMLEETSNIFMLLAAAQGGTTPKTFYIKADSTPTVEDPGTYADHSKIIAAGGATTVVYLGIEAPGGSTLEKTDNDVGVSAVFMLFFGHEDNAPSGFGSEDDPYSQNIPFKALRLIT